MDDTIGDAAGQELPPADHLHREVCVLRLELAMAERERDHALEVLARVGVDPWAVRTAVYDPDAALAPHLAPHPQSSPDGLALYASDDTAADVEVRE
jgi:hypothetical protein